MLAINKILLISYLFFCLVFSILFNKSKKFPIWISNQKLLTELKKRRRKMYLSIFTEGYISFILWPFMYLFQRRYRKPTYKFLSNWKDLEKYVTELITNIDNFNSYDTVLGVNFGGALMADYITYKYKNIKYKGYIRPFKKRSKIFIFFWLQLIYSYLDVFKHIVTNNRNPKSNIKPYYTTIKWINFDKKNSKKVLIIDDGLLSGSTSIACIDYCLNYFNPFHI